MKKVPLVSIPTIDEPFQRIALDFVGPLPLTESKNRFIMVCVDYATKYPIAVALKNQEAETVAWEYLLTWVFQMKFSRIRVVILCLN